MTLERAAEKIRIAATERCIYRQFGIVVQRQGGGESGASLVASQVQGRLRGCKADFGSLSLAGKLQCHRLTVELQACRHRLARRLCYLAVECQCALSLNTRRQQRGKVDKRQVTQPDLAVACPGRELSAQTQLRATALPAFTLTSTAWVSTMPATIHLPSPAATAGRKFIGGLPMKPPTKRSTGVW